MCKTVVGAVVLTMRPTGLGSGIDKDRQDYTVYTGGWDIGRIYEVEAARASAVVLGVALSQQAGGPSHR